MRRSTTMYLLSLVVFGFIVWRIIGEGNYLVPGNTTDQQETIAPGRTQDPGFLERFGSPTALVLVQIIIIVAVSRIFGRIITRFGQPAVIGEILAGILLGPSLIGWLFPEFSQYIFPRHSLDHLHFLSEAGLMAFMFIIGMELDPGKLKNKARSAVAVSHSGILVPFMLGVGLAYFLFESYSASESFAAFALFMGIAMSITAFPVLARILHEKNMTHSQMGILVLACAATEDVTAWCILAAIIAIVKSADWTGALWTIFFAILYISAMIFIVRPWLSKFAEKIREKEKKNRSVIIVIFGIALLSCLFAEVIGIHALFGAFIAGVIVPARYKTLGLLTGRTHEISILLLLPVFFAFTGLRTQIGLLNDVEAWLICGAVVLIAIVGKFGGCSIAARLGGHSWKDSFTIGILMNTRGLMELIVLNIGYDLGILSAEIFTIMVIMALITTLMTGPTMDLFNRIFSRQRSQPSIHN